MKDKKIFNQWENQFLKNDALRYIKKYFDKKADTYSLRSASFPWRLARRLEKKAVMKLMFLEKGDNILDVGCGAGFYSAIFYDAGYDIFAVDLSSAMVEKVKSLGVKTKVCDIESFDLGIRFDKILCAGTLEFCTNVPIALKSLKRHLKDKGIIVLLLPRLSILGIIYKMYHSGHRINIQLFSLNKIKHILSEADLEITKIQQPTPYAYAIQARKESS